MARGLKTNKTMTIGVLIPSLENVFFTTIVSHVEDILLKNGYGTIICDYKEDPKLEKEKFGFLVDKSVDGIIMVPSGEDLSFIREYHADIPIVLLDRMIKGFECDYVLTDNINASYNAVEHLIIQNHKKIAIICGPQNLYTATERLEGYMRVHQDYQLIPNETYVQFGDYTIQSGYHIMKKLWQMKEKPTAVYVTNYEMTLGVIMAVNDLRMEIPAELSIIGFDNIHLADVLRPALTIVVQPMGELARQSAELILKRLRNNYDGFPAISRFKTQLLTKESTQKI